MEEVLPSRGTLNERETGSGMSVNGVRARVGWPGEYCLLVLMRLPMSNVADWWSVINIGVFSRNGTP